MSEIKLPAEFQSGNSVPVERATITRQRMTEILAEAIEAALQSQDREDAAYESGRRCGLGFAHSVVSEILRKHYYGSGVEGLSKLVQQATDALAREINNPTTATTDIDQARRIEGKRG